MKRKPPCTPGSVHKNRRAQIIDELIRPLTPEELSRVPPMPHPWTRPWFEQMIRQEVGLDKLLGWEVEETIGSRGRMVTVRLTFWPDGVTTITADHLAHKLKMTCWKHKPADTHFHVLTHRAPTS